MEDERLEESSDELLDEPSEEESDGLNKSIVEPVKGKEVEYYGRSIYAPGSGKIYESLPQRLAFMERVMKRGAEFEIEEKLNDKALDKYIADLGEIVVEAMSTYPKTAEHARDFVNFFSRLRLAVVDPDEQGAQKDLSKILFYEANYPLLEKIYDPTQPADEKDLRVNARVILFRFVVDEIARELRLAV